VTEAALSAVSRTALGVVRARAVESARADRLFDDPFAQGFLDALGSEALPLTPALQLHVAVRTRFYDDYLRDAGCPQVVVLGAGLDTRAHRLAWPDGTTLFELDLPPVLALKAALLAPSPVPPACRRVPLGVDLREPWDVPLRAAGLDPAVPTAWLAEGLLVYLDGPEVEAVLATVGALSAPGSRLACEGPRGGTGATEAAGEVAQLWRGGLGAELPERLRARGWEVATTRLADLARGYGRAGAEAATSTFLVAQRPARPPL
jgi:methyltransferase (TIGR00027 family)